MTMTPRAMGTSVRRVDGPEKAIGCALYAADHAAVDAVHLYPVLSTVPRGRVLSVDTAAAAELPGVLCVLTSENAERMADTSDREWTVLQDRDIDFRGQIVAAVLAHSAEVARQAAGLVAVDYEEAPFRARFDEASGELFTPELLNLNHHTDTTDGDVDAGLGAAAVTVDEVYRTAMTHPNPMEPHAAVALWRPDGAAPRLTVHDTTQSVTATRANIARLIGLDEDDIEVLCPHVGGGFGSKGNSHAHLFLTVLAARAVPGRPVRFALTREQMYTLVGYRTPTVQRVRLAASAEGRLTAITHDVVQQTARYKTFGEQTAVYSRSMYAAPARRTSHRLDPLDVPVPTWMRAPGECPGSFAAEVAMDELAVACGLDPIELRLRNEPDVDPENGKPFSSRNLVACLKRGAERFAWHTRRQEPRSDLRDGWWHGTGLAACAFPTMRLRSSTATIRYRAGHYAVAIAAADLGTGARTALTQIAADALDVGVEQIELSIGDTAAGPATVGGASSGTASWGATIVDAAERFRDKYGEHPDDGDEADGTTPDNPWAEEYSMHAYGAHFAEVAVHADTGEVRVPRMLGVFAAGRILNPATARSQFLGGMTMGLSMALHEESVLDPRFGHVVNHDLAGYHVATSADVGQMDAEWIDEDDPYVNPMGAKGIGEIGIVGAAAAIANAASHATGIRVRSTPLKVEHFLGG
ncbi:xanthine dehydrogenase family protein molybdopterin-binding subunit [Actinomycetospora termitidis]|uniref:Xanthine dehydrogenase family protein molybdopterin-binding subunit n=1 Tax=Actinomycetospora termitidis TaxID=3053470 RepID=A0ABT7MIS8_9PSEU|nr:xanthine dehydrogenase family protein molybdopterin-binding subunit [Actinomycetospora sp. Odt1-22]MDL5160579.1 xanthine dehydrogenase family protein molybdopterin-binding subunit [Actinomycetospora sp. Odt1-22]